MQAETGTAAPEGDDDKKPGGDGDAGGGDAAYAEEAVAVPEGGGDAEGDEKGGGGADANVEGAGRPRPSLRPGVSYRMPSSYPPSFFTDHRGNLKAVNLVVRRPCLVLWIILAICVVIFFLLVVLVFRTADNGNPFTLDTNNFELGHVTSVQYHSYRLAREEVAERRKAAGGEAAKAEITVVPKQSQDGDIAYWVFESETPAGLFGSREAIEGMKAAYDIFYADPAFKDWCRLDYPRPTPPTNKTKGNETESPSQSPSQSPIDATNQTERPIDPAEVELECKTPLTPLTMYYPSEWDEDAAGEVIEQLKDPAKLEKFNALSVCAIGKQYCERLIGTPGEDLVWAEELGAKIENITDKWDMKGELVDNFPQVTELASYLMQVGVLKGVVDFGFDKEFSASNPVSHYSRGVIVWGSPLEERNQSSTDEEDDSDDDPNKELDETEDDKRKKFIKDNYLAEMNSQAALDEHASINSYYFMTAIIGDVLLNIVTKDALLAIFSFVFVFIWIRVNTLSWFLAFVGFFEIFFSIPIAWFIFTVIFRIKYFAFLNSLALFVVAAIGADDIFIFMDAYKQSQYHPEILCDLETRMSWVYRRTGVAMAITSATTCAAFLCTLITPLPSLQSFGIFSAVVIFIDYALVMTLFCTSVVIYHNRYENNGKFGCCCPCGPVVPSNTEQARTALEDSDGEIKRDRVSEFFKTKVAGFIMVPLHRLVLGVVFVVWLGIAIWQASQLEATKEQEQFLSEDHPLQKSFTIIGREFPTADNDPGLKVHYVWGAGEVDRAGVNILLDPENYGSPTFVPEFDFNKQCQTDLLSFCDKLKTDSEYSELIKRKKGLGVVSCFVEELGAFNVARSLSASDDCEYMRKGEWKDADWQVGQDDPDLPKIMKDFLEKKTCSDEDGRDTVGGWYGDDIGWDGSAFVYAAVSAESNVLSPFSLDSESLTRNEYDQFVAIAEEQGAIISASCGAPVIMTDLDEKFPFMNNQGIYVRSSYQSAILGVVIAFLVLLISTRVFHLALIASLSIVCVLISVVGMMVILGWRLGAIESTLIGIIAGFSVDYVVHLAHAYEIPEGGSMSTYDRITESFSDLGISVFNGMITSIVASLPLFFCQLQFFAKFGAFLCLTIAFSWIFANFAFMSVLAQLKIPLKERKHFRDGKFGCRL